MRSEGGLDRIHVERAVHQHRQRQCALGVKQGPRFGEVFAKSGERPSLGQNSAFRQKVRRKRIGIGRCRGECDGNLGPGGHVEIGVPEQETARGNRRELDAKRRHFTAAVVKTRKAEPRLPLIGLGKTDRKARARPTIVDLPGAARTWDHFPEAGRARGDRIADQSALGRDHIPAFGDDNLKRQAGKQRCVQLHKWNRTGGVLGGEEIEHTPPGPRELHELVCRGRLDCHLRRGKVHPRGKGLSRRGAFRRGKGRCCRPFRRFGIGQARQGQNGQSRSTGDLSHGN